MLSKIRGVSQVPILVALSLILLTGCTQNGQAPAGNPDAPAQSTAPTTAEPDAAADYDTFAESYLETIKAKPTDLTFTLNDDNSIACSQNGKVRFTINLDNAYNEYLNNGDMEAVINHYVESTLEILTGSDSVPDKSSIMAVIKPADYIATIKGMASNPVYEPLLGKDLYVLYVMDLPNSVKVLDESSLEALGVERDELRALAVENLDRTLPEPTITQERGIYIVSVDGMYEASLLITGFLDNADIPVTGDMVIGAPSRDMLLIADSSNQDALNILAGFTQSSYQQASYPVSGRLMKYADKTLSWY